MSTEQALTVLLHDVVYVPGAPTGVNDAQSVDYTRNIQSSASTHHSPDWDLVDKIILDTASNVPTCRQSELVLMLDLSSLGGSPLEFAVANELVWLENRHLLQAATEPRKEFCTRRLAFLDALLVKGPLFTGVFADLETRWRDNVSKLRGIGNKNGGVWSNNPSKHEGTGSHRNSSILDCLLGRSLPICGHSTTPHCGG